MLISTALLLDSIIRNSVCSPAKLPCRRVEVGYEIRTLLPCNVIVVDLKYFFRFPKLLNSLLRRIKYW
jgi:hypothetical protein